MPRYKSFIPLRDGAFFGFQDNLVNWVVAHKAAWGIPDAAVDALTSRRAEYGPLYEQVQEKGARTAAQVLAHRETRRIYEPELRVFVNAYIRHNPAISDGDRVAMGVPPRDTKPSRRPQITDIPAIGLTGMGGGEIKVICRRMTDQDRPSLHPDADAIEARFTLAPIAGRMPNDPETCTGFQFSTRAKFFIDCGAAAAGQKFCGFFRWVNLTNPAHSGPWTPVKNVVVG